MRVHWFAAALAGILAGLVFGMMIQMMMAPTPEGGQMPVAKVVRSNSLVVGWLYHLFNSAVIGALFGWVAARRVDRYSAGLLWGAAYGVLWWLLGGLILMPALLGMPAFAPLMMEPMRPVAMGSLIGHLIYGLILGGAFVLFTRHGTTTLRPA